MDSAPLAAIVSAPGTRTADYDFDLPVERIAQTPVEPRDASRLMHVDRASGAVTHRRFADLVDLIPPGDVLVLNRTRVFRARLLGRRATTGAPAEVLLLRPLGEGCFEAMVAPGNKLKSGRHIEFAAGFSAQILELTDRGTRIVRLLSDSPVDEAIERFGHVPLPPYIVRGDCPGDAERYQTVYAREPGSAAAPTAGLHFTPELLGGLQRRGVARADIVLHIGAGTFKPVVVDDPADHLMHREFYSVPESAARTINAVRAEGGRAWAVGTTTARTLESTTDETGVVLPADGETALFIRPGHRFRAVDRLITNFHLPRSTLLMLVTAMAGYELTMRAYRIAIEHGYRFYSYGDAMVIT
ncbi:MAG TPA: tRNA preQ1(34) S-adenosylmethionine ribosyltransferase-isomerase QueA [Gemmatimonadaceae bacterium]|nr:tRNA preQ1(34) S-adenosylmethionine ribosyltransferase-isomerase QueA [Gemmatimonadaceae bacterium]